MLTMRSPAIDPVLPPWPDDRLSFAPLPASGDDGFPQAFLLELRGVVYRLTMAVYYRDPDIVLNPAYANAIFELPNTAKGLSLNLAVEYEERPADGRMIGSQRVVLDMPMAFGPLRIRFRRVRVAQANLAGPGSFGSELVAEVAVSDG